MEKESARNPTLEQLHERRKQVVRPYKQGVMTMQIVQMSGLSYPTVRGAIDFFEAGGCSAVRGTNFAPTGKTPVATVVGDTRQKLSMIATVTNQGKTRWMIIDEAFDAEKRIEFVQALVKDTGKKVVLILDNLRVHHSKLAQGLGGSTKRPHRVVLPVQLQPTAQP